MDIASHTITSLSSGNARTVWLLPSLVTVEHKLCVFLDAELYLDRLDAPAIIRGMTARRELAPVTSVFVSHTNAVARHRDYTCNALYSEFITREIVGWVRERVPALPASGHVVCGLSLSGLAGASLAATHPRVFSAALCQSAAFWWNDETFSQRAVETRPSGGTYWISVGDKETEVGVSHPPTGLRQDVSQIVACARAAEVLQSLGNRVHYSMFDGGHEIGPWKAELPTALKWIMKNCAR